MPVLEYCSAVWCSAADTHLRLQNRVVSFASFLTVGVFECDLGHRRSVAALCKLNKIRSNPMHPLYGALPVTRDVVIAHRCTYAPPRCRTSQYRRTFIPLSVSLWNDLSDPVLDGVGKPLLLSVSLLSFYGLVLWGWGLRTDGVLLALP